MSTSAYWPAGLPTPRMGASYTTAMVRQASDFEHAQRERVTGKNYRQHMPVTWLMTESEFQLFIAWWVHTCADGTAWFTMEWDGRSGLARFQSKYDSRQDGNLRSVSAQVLIDYVG